MWPGTDHWTGSVEVGKLADLVIWKPASFGTKPSMVIKSGMIAYAMMVSLHLSFLYIVRHGEAQLGHHDVPYSGAVMLQILRRAH